MKLVKPYKVFLLASLIRISCELTVFPRSALSSADSISFIYSERQFIPFVIVFEYVCRRFVESHFWSKTLNKISQPCLKFFDLILLLTDFLLCFLALGLFSLLLSSDFFSLSLVCIFSSLHARHRIWLLFYNGLLR